MEEDNLDDIAIQAIVELLTGDNAPPQINTVFADRIFPVVAPDNSLPPYLVFSQLDEQTVSTKDGDIPNGWSFDIAIYAADYLSLKKGARAVRLAVNGKDTTVEGIGKIHLLFENESQEVFDPTRELLTLVLEFRGVPTN